MVIIKIMVGAAAFTAWLSAVVHSIWSLAHLSGKSTLQQMLFGGLRWFDSENFTPRGLQLQRRFWLSSLAFLVSAGAIAVVDALSHG